MSKRLIGQVVFGLIAIGAIAVTVRKLDTQPTTPATVQTDESTAQLDAEPSTTTDTPPSNPLVAWPMDRGSERVTKVTFGLYVNPQDSPIQPQRFTGYHTGWDFEIFPDELNKDVPVLAFCDGPLRLKQTANGYGGVAVQECNIDGTVLTAIYGHIRLSSVTAAVGEEIAKGDQLGLLGRDRSSETDGERKHLHFDLHKGSSINIRGYVSSSGQLDDWINPGDYL